MEKKQDPKNEQLKKFAKYSGLGIQMGITIYLGNLLGTWLDEKYEVSSELYSKLLTLFAVIISTYAVIREVIKDTK